jgi:hypothetical protein
MNDQSVKKGIVKKMREIRDNLSNEIMNMSLEQEKEYIKKQLEQIKNAEKSG